MPQSVSHGYGLLAIALASVLWGTTGTAASFAPGISSLAIGAFAMGGGGLLLVLSARNRLLADLPRLRQHPALLLLGGAAVAIYPLAFYTSMRLAGVAIGTVVSIASAPFFAALLERLFSKTRVSRHWLFSFALGALGIALLAIGKAPDSAATHSAAHTTWGVLLGLLAALTYASYAWAARGLIHRGVSSQSAMASMFGLAAVVLLPSLAWTGDTLLASANNAAVAVYMAIVPMFLGYVLFGLGLRVVEASQATLITLIEPLVATVLAIVVVGEGFKTVGWLGMALVFVCLVLQTRRSQQPLPPATVADEATVSCP
ncbi:EamA family transporter [Aestuariibacter halophilus]|uniref:EamA family transporter n=1 Tax=Fluctibacter halophilus TaxID=226011 RepID=A0ABS8G7G0_9ALTE|nr:EamA family transporter [Aestuariibacter halophilus]MCC2616529.1 EamA family transporter [Aestuariibacter halophilus]